MGPTQRDVAAEAGVSPMTVSNVLNGRHGRASAATVQRVMAAVERLGYVPYAPARVLSSRRSDLVALVYPATPDGVAALMNPHDSVFVSEVERWVSGADRYLMVQSTYDVVTTAASLRGWQVDGAIFLGTWAGEIDGLREHHDVPMVFVDNYSSSPQVSRVGIDDRRAGQLAAAHLAAAGHERFGFVGPSRDRDGVVRRRYLGFVETLSQSGLRLDSAAIVERNTTFEDGIAAAEQLLSSPRPPTAVFATADILTAGLMKGYVAHGRRVPDDVSLLGCDDLPLCRQLTPELSTVRQDVPAKARMAVELLLRLMSTWPQSMAEQHELDVVLVERDTVAPPLT